MKKFSNSKKKILLIAQDNIFGDPRIQRIYEYLLKKKILLHTASSSPEIKKNHFVLNFEKDFSLRKLFSQNILKFFLLLIKILIGDIKSFCYPFYNSLDNLNLNEYDHIFIFDLKILYSVANRINNKKIIWDAREYYPEQFNQNFLWYTLFNKIIIKLIKKSLNKVLIAYTVSKNIGKKYQKVFRKKFLIFYSVADYNKLKPKVPKIPVSIVHHGICSYSRKIENYFELGKLLGKNYQIFLMLKIVNKNYYIKLKKTYSNVKNVKFIKPVNMKGIPKKINKFDIGIFIGLKSSFNHMHAMPNKLFESIQGRLCIISNPLVDYSNFTRKNNCGYSSTDFTIKELSVLIKSLSINKIYKAKIASHKIAKQYNKKKLYIKFDKIFLKLF